MSPQTNGATWTLPVLPLKGTVLLPGLFLPLSVGRPQTRAAVEAALASEDKMLIVVAQRDPTQEKPALADLYAVGVRAVIKKMAHVENAVELLVQGVDRVLLQTLEQTEPFLKAHVQAATMVEQQGPEIEALYRALVDQTRHVLQLAQPEAEGNFQQLLSQVNNPMQLVYLLASMLGLDVAREQAILEANTPTDAMRTLVEYLGHEAQVLELRNQITNKAQHRAGQGAA